MKDGLIKAAAVTPVIRVADPVYNAEQIKAGIDEARSRGAKIIVFPELCITGYTCGDLFLQDRLLEGARRQLMAIAKHTEGGDALVFVGLPLEREGKLYNAAAAVQNGKVLALFPKTFIPDYAEFYEGRYFTPGIRRPVTCRLGGEEIPFGTSILLEVGAVEGLRVGCEICEDVWAPLSPAVFHALAGATVIVNLSASDETVGKDGYRELLIKSSSARLIAGYVYASAGEGESTQDLVFGGHNLIVENGTVLSRSERFKNQTVCGDLDIARLRQERRRMNTFGPSDVLRETRTGEGYLIIPVSMRQEETRLDRTFPTHPFVPEEAEKRRKRCEEILSIQAMGLKKRMEHTGCTRAVLGVSGGLDSTLALLVTARTFDRLGLDRKGIMAVTMPCFGTTDRTYENACAMARVLGVELREVPIAEAVRVHFRDIGQPEDRRDVTYENSQARERTQVLMDLANQCGGLVVGTGDMSELALGWATYNGDHMSMYGVNAGVPKTLVRHLVGYYSDTCGNPELSRVLEDVLDTPVSPELLPPRNGVIAQRTEDLVGPYELHDFFLYNMLRWGFAPSKIYRIAVNSFAGIYEEEVIGKWLEVFYRRFFAQQFKRSCLPDGPKVGSVALSPRGDLRMPSDASARLWLDEIENLTRNGNLHQR